MASRTRRAVGVTAALLVAPLVLAACGSGGSGGSGDGDPVTIEFFQSKTESIDVVDQLIADFEASHEGITVEQTAVPDALTVLTTRLAKNDIPDVIGINVSNLNDIATAGILADQSGTEAAAAVDNTSAQEYVDALSAGLGTVAVPWTVNAQVVLYDVDQFAELGLEVPTTWDEFIALARTVEDQGAEPFSFTWKDAWTAKLVFNSIAGSLQGPDFWSELQDGSVTFSDSPAYAETTEKLIELTRYAQPDPFGQGYDDGNAAFADGDSVMYVQGTWAIPEIRATNPDKNIGTFVLPAGDSADDTVLLSGPDSVLGVSNSSEHAEAAQEFVDYLMSADAQTTYSEDQFLFSVRGDVPATDEALSALKSDWLDTGRVAMYPDSMFTGASDLQALVQQFLQDQDATGFLSAVDTDYATNGVQ
jgi:raffinose/stachyose/melibiose transport system substrate-binding protein